MRISLHRALVAASAVTVIAFLIAGIAGNHHPGLRGALGDIAWFTFMVGLLLVVALSIVVLTQSARRRRHRKNQARLG